MHGPIKWFKMGMTQQNVIVLTNTHRTIPTTGGLTIISFTLHVKEESRQHTFVRKSVYRKRCSWEHLASGAIGFLQIIKNRRSLQPCKATFRSNVDAKRFNPTFIDCIHSFLRAELGGGGTSPFESLKRKTQPRLLPFDSLKWVWRTNQRRHDYRKSARWLVDYLT